MAHCTTDPPNSGEFGYKTRYTRTGNSLPPYDLCTARTGDAAHAPYDQNRPITIEGYGADIASASAMLSSSPCTCSNTSPFLHFGEPLIEHLAANRGGVLD